MYCVTNYKTKKALIADFKAGKSIEVYQPGGFFTSKRDGSVAIEGPHYPQPHRWYASANIKDGIITSVK
jgi:hypothetical protein